MKRNKVDDHQDSMFGPDSKNHSYFFYAPLTNSPENNIGVSGKGNKTLIRAILIVTNKNKN